MTMDYSLFIPEIALLLVTLTILMVEVYVGEKAPRAGYWMAQTALFGVGMYTVFTFSLGAEASFSGGYVRDVFGDVVKLFIYLTGFLTLVYSKRYAADRKMLRGEFYAMILFAILGAQVLVSAFNLLTIYMGLELMSLSLYTLVTWRRDDVRITEAAMKYFVLGSLASGILLYGMSMIYGATGHIQIDEIARVVAQSPDSQLFNFGLVFLVVGVAFKLGVVPFHMWMPDVYHGSPTVITLFLATVSKLAAFAMLIRLWVDALSPSLEAIQPMVMMLCAASIIVGNVVAIAQSNLKRMLAYSAISHMGFVLMGIAAGTDQGNAAALYYMIVYTLTGAAGFGLILLLSTATNESDQLADLKGLAKRAPKLALLLLIIMFSMAGIPPTIGFYAKLLVLEAAVDADLVWLAVLGVSMSVVGAFYYLRVIKLMYFDEAENPEAVAKPDADSNLILNLNVGSLIVLGVFPAPLIALCFAIFGL